MKSTVGQHSFSLVQFMPRVKKNCQILLVLVREIFKYECRKRKAVFSKSQVLYLHMEAASGVISGGEYECGHPPGKCLSC